MTKSFDLHNPTPARRVIYDGLRERPIEIGPGDTLKGVPLAPHIADRFLGIMARMGEGRCLELSESNDDPDEATAPVDGGGDAAAVSTDDDVAEAEVVPVKAAEAAPKRVMLHREKRRRGR